MKSKNINFGNSTVGEASGVFIIAEAGVNHNGDIKIAKKLIRKAKEIGADCVKFQTFKAKNIVTKNAPKAKYQLEVTNETESQFEMLKKLELSYEDHEQMIELCKVLNIQFLSTPYNIEDARFLHELGVDAFKVASGQIVETPFLVQLAAFNKPLILSSGMANLGEVYDAVKTVRDAGNNNIVLLQCTTNYPSSLEDANIKSMVAMGHALDVMIGYSDHIETNEACYAAVALGAKVIEKHFTLDRSMKGPDHKASLNPEEFKKMIQGVKGVEKSLGSPVKFPSEVEINNTKGMRRSIASVGAMKKGDRFSKEVLGFKRPATGLSPKYLEDIIGKVANVDITPDQIITQDMVAWDS